ncbi:MAG TPA: N-acetylmuramoyl-L-alanine amidase [Gaiellaceae bacterium]|nr:N-acetylmuramoyl-L-alanine amidase [Gaiellaceae bacterium]
MRKLAVFVAVLTALAAPALARAGDVAMRVQEIALHGRVLQAAQPPMNFNMFATHWTGSGTVFFRTHRLHGSWSAWTAADADGDHTGAWHDGSLDWTGASDGIQFRTTGSVERLKAYELWSRVTTAARGLSSATEPAIVTRAQWHANQEIVRAKPIVAPVLKLAVVHHTAGSNSYTRAQSAAIVRGIQLYHVQGNGWNDIGYNFLVDRYGTVYEGRGGGLTKNVVGAHAEGFNSGTVGVALIGNFSVATPPKAMQDALVNLLAWRLDVAHIDPLATVAYTSGGNLKFKAGKVVTLHAISGHRDTGPSECPGAKAYALLPGLAQRVAETGLPKIYSPIVAGVLGGPVRFRARLSSSLPWTVTVTSAAGEVAAHGSGSGDLVDWTWQSPTEKASYTWTIATDGALSATGTIGGPVKAPPPAALAITAVSTAPPLVSGTAMVTFTLSVAAHVTATLTDAAGNSRQLFDGDEPVGVNSVAWDATGVVDGRYSLTLVASTSTATATQSAPVIVDRTLTELTVQDTSVSFSLSQTVPVVITVQQGDSVLATLYSGTLAAGQHTVSWDGTDGLGTLFPPGDYTLVVTFTDALGAVPVSAPVVLQPVAA